MKFYRKLSLLLILLCFTTVIAGGTQSGVCTEWCKKRCRRSATTARPTGRNQACYGYVSLGRRRARRPEFQLRQSGRPRQRRRPRLAASEPLNTDSETWGIALMKIQANLPDTLPGQNVTFLMFGDVQIDNAVDSGAATVDVTANSGINVRSGPGTSNQVSPGRWRSGEATSANGRNADSSWLRIQIPTATRWAGCRRRWSRQRVT